jgi:hypothetical protein
MDFLKEEGYVPKVNNNGDVTFKYEGERFYIDIDEKDPEYFCMYAVGNWKCETDEEKQRLYNVVYDANIEIKMVKTFIFKENTVNENTVVTAIECLVNNEEYFKKNFIRWSDTLKGTINRLCEKMKVNE